MLVGYARVSTFDQNLDLQRDALLRVGCEKLFEEVASGATTARPSLVEALEYARQGDTLVVWRLDRFGRSLKDLIARFAELDARGIGFRSLTEGIDTTSPTGRLVFHIFGGLAEFELELTRERTRAGLESARARGRKGGRPRRVVGEQLQVLSSAFADKRNAPGDLCETWAISRSTLYRSIKAAGAQRPTSLREAGDERLTQGRSGP